MRQHATIHHPPDAVGRRVVIRYRLHDDEYGATDVIGTLTRADSEQLTVKTAWDTHVHVKPADVIALKVVPPQTVTRRHVRDLEAAAALGWQGLEATKVGSWLLRAAGGFTGRANSCLPLDGPGMPVHDALETVEHWYEERGLRPNFQIPEPIGATLQRALDAQGWPPMLHKPVIVMTARIDRVRNSGHQPDLPEARIDQRPDEPWLENYHYRGGDLPPHAVDVMVNAETVGFAGLREQGEFVAGARGAVTSAPSGRRWLGVTAVEVTPHARRRGLGGHIMAELAAWGEAHDATDVYVQVASENAAGIATYDRLGFTEHHTYQYRIRE
jgi:ribosomal protein S18 acetylase RimI-like enzyme